MIEYSSIHSFVRCFVAQSSARFKVIKWVWRTWVLLHFPHISESNHSLRSDSPQSCYASECDYVRTCSIIHMAHWCVFPINTCITYALFTFCIYYEVFSLWIILPYTFIRPNALSFCRSVFNRIEIRYEPIIRVFVCGFVPSFPVFKFAHKKNFCLNGSREQVFCTQWNENQFPIMCSFFRIAPPFENGNARRSIQENNHYFVLGTEWAHISSSQAAKWSTNMLKLLHRQILGNKRGIEHTSQPSMK